MTHDFGKVKKRAQEELKRFLIIFAYLFVVLALFQMHEYLILRQHGIPYERYGFALIQALILAKVMLIGEAMQLGRMSDRSRILIIIFRAAIFALFFLAFKILEEAARALIHREDILHNITAPGGSTPASIILALILWIMLIPYFGFVELGRGFGIDSLRHVLFSAEDKHVEAEFRS